MTADVPLPVTVAAGSGCARLPVSVSILGPARVHWNSTLSGITTIVSSDDPKQTDELRLNRVNFSHGFKLPPESDGAGGPTTTSLGFTLSESPGSFFLRLMNRRWPRVPSSYDDG